MAFTPVRGHHPASTEGRIIRALEQLGGKAPSRAIAYRAGLCSNKVGTYARYMPEVRTEPRHGSLARLVILVEPANRNEDEPPASKRRPLRGRRRDAAVAPVIGTMLMLALVVAMMPAAVELFDAVESAADEQSAAARAQADEARAERERAEQAAWCARNPNLEPDGFDCPDSVPPGYSCKHYHGTSTYVCWQDGNDSAGGGISLPDQEALDG